MTGQIEWLADQTILLHLSYTCTLLLSIPTVSSYPYPYLYFIHTESPRLLSLLSWCAPTPVSHAVFTILYIYVFEAGIRRTCTPLPATTWLLHFPGLLHHRGNMGKCFLDTKMRSQHGISSASSKGFLGPLITAVGGHWSKIRRQ